MPWWCNLIFSVPRRNLWLNSRMPWSCHRQRESSNAELKAIMFSLVLSLCKAQVEFVNQLWLREKHCLLGDKHGMFSVWFLLDLIWRHIWISLNAPLWQQGMQWLPKDGNSVFSGVAFDAPEMLVSSTQSEALWQCITKAWTIEREKEGVSGFCPCIHKKPCVKWTW